MRGASAADTLYVVEMCSLFSSAYQASKGEHWAEGRVT